MSDHRFQLASSAATAEEAAAAIAAVQQFVADHAPVLVTGPPARDAWQRAALLEGVGRDPEGPSPWGDGHPWG